MEGMSLLEHLAELRTRLVRALFGIAAAFGVSLLFCDQLWKFVSQPARHALLMLGINPPNLAQIAPLETFNVIWFRLPIVCAIFLSSPWLLYQVWAFISPGLYRRERRLAAPFILCSAGLFILGGLFAYFVAFRFAITFLLGIDRDKGISPVVSVNEYFDLFVNVVLGVSLLFELPVIIFFFTLLRIVTPSFLIRHSRYAILIIFVVAAFVTPTPDAINMMLFALPMCALFYVGVFAGYLLVLKRDERRFPWQRAITIGLALLLVLATGLYVAIASRLLTVVPHWPYLMR